MPTLTTIRQATTRLIARRRGVAIAAISFAVVTAAACGGDSTGPKDNVSGTYSLQSAANHALPATIFQDQVTLNNSEPADLEVTVNSGSVTLTSDGKFNGTMSLVFNIITAGGQQTQTQDLPIAGTYTRSGNTINFVSSAASAPPFTAQYSANSLTIASLDVLGLQHPVAFVFMK